MLFRLIIGRRQVDGDAVFINTQERAGQRGRRDSDVVVAFLWPGGCGRFLSFLSSCSSISQHLFDCFIRGQINGRFVIIILDVSGSPEFEQN